MAEQTKFHRFPSTKFRLLLLLVPLHSIRYLDTVVSFLSVTNILLYDKFDQWIIHNFSINLVQNIHRILQQVRSRFWHFVRWIPICSADYTHPPVWPLFINVHQTCQHFVRGRSSQKRSLSGLFQSRGQFRFSNSNSDDGNFNSNSDDGNSNSIPSPMLSIPLNSVIHIDRTKLNLR